MTNKPEKAKSQDVAPVLEQAPAISLKEFCIRLSETEKRVELIGGFEADERRQGRLNDTASNYTGRFQAFVSRPA
jgi:hypothetical protein